MIPTDEINNSWASAMDRDQYGLWAEFEINDVIQQMRWIPPGEFVMGSPKDEPGRWQDEGPQHTVRIHHGFWMFDTPVTQALWQAVMGADNNPSHFSDNPQHPVERVTWYGSQKFITKLNQIKPGLELTLLSEAQWEYACRAGTESAIYAEDLDAIAWYDANSSGDTHPVKLKQPNDWGLYDMVGNVFEWVQDAKHEGYEGAPSDGSAWVDNEAAAERVVRGGSWSGEARDCRSAARHWDPPDVVWRLQGFRCARIIKKLKARNDP